MVEGIRRVTYICTECKAEDHPLFFANEQIPAAVNCWNCRAGRQYPSPEQQFQAHEGMLLQQEDDTVEQESLASA